MRNLRSHLLLPLLASLPISHARPSAADPARPLPLVIWHGLGDKFDNDGLRSTGELAQHVHPGTEVVFVRLDDDGGKDQQATFFGNVSAQIAQVCVDLRRDARLRDPRDLAVVRVDAMGFSQGGQFLRGLVQTCEGVSVRSLVTFGSQHNGIAEFQACGTWDFWCKGANAVMRGNAWTDYVQGRVVPAQYYRTLNETTGLASDEYLRASGFLADANNEREKKNRGYAKRLAALDKFVMYVFANDTTVIPKESGWFAEVNRTSEEVTHLRDRPIYKEDWLGLKELDEKGGLVFRSTPGGHMALDEAVLTKVYKEFFGPESRDHPAQTSSGTSPFVQTSSFLWSTDEQQQRRWENLWFWQRWRKQCSVPSMADRPRFQENL